jgi:hypothetical protein
MAGQAGSRYGHSALSSAIETRVLSGGLLVAGRRWVDHDLPGLRCAQLRSGVGSRAALSFAPVVVANWRLTMPSLTPQRARPNEHGAKQMFGADPCAALGRATPARRDLAYLGRGTSLAQVISSDVSDASANPHGTDGLDAGGRIWRGRIRLRALWGDFPVVVRVHSGAWKSPAQPQQGYRHRPHRHGDDTNDPRRGDAAVARVGSACEPEPRVQARPSHGGARADPCQREARSQGGSDAHSTLACVTITTLERGPPCRIERRQDLIA